MKKNLNILLIILLFIFIFMYFKYYTNTEGFDVPFYDTKTGLTVILVVFSVVMALFYIFILR